MSLPYDMRLYWPAKFFPGLKTVEFADAIVRFTPPPTSTRMNALFEVWGVGVVSERVIVPSETFARGGSFSKRATASSLSRVSPQTRTRSPGDRSGSPVNL